MLPLRLISHMGLIAPPTSLIVQRTEITIAKNAQQMLIDAAWYPTQE